jgi:hypothetical protein
MTEISEFSAWMSSEPSRPPQICRFCQQTQAVYSPLEPMESYGCKIFFCHPCQAEYLFYSRDNILTSFVGFSLYATISEKMYRWSVHTNETRATLWWVKTPGIPGTRINRDLISLLQIYDDLPTITPQNIEARIRKWLLLL